LPFSPEKAAFADSAKGIQEETQEQDDQEKCCPCFSQDSVQPLADEITMATAGTTAQELRVMSEDKTQQDGEQDGGKYQDADTLACPEYLQAEHICPQDKEKEGDGETGQAKPVVHEHSRHPRANFTGVILHPNVRSGENIGPHEILVLVPGKKIRHKSNHHIGSQ